MNTIDRIETWGEAHHPRWVDFIRIALGLFLIYKGVDFLRNIGDIMNLMNSSNTSFGSFKTVAMAHIIVVLHIMGGILIAIGLFTRLACLVQIPILLGAVLFINISGATRQPAGELILSVIVLGLLIYFLIVGNGPLSYEKMYHGDERKQRNE
jgi:putative oxidoreductase